MLLTLDSSTINQTSHDFTIDFPNEIFVKGSQYELGLLKCNLWYSYYNVKSNSNTFQYTNNLAQTRTVTIPFGNYSIIDLNNYIHSVMKTNGDYSVILGIDTFNINIEPNYNTLRTILELTNSYTINFTISDFSLLLGFDKLVYNFSGTQEGQEVANINDGVNSLLIHCDIVAKSYQNNISSDILFTFVPDQPPGSNLEVYSKNEVIYLPIKNFEFIRTIRLYITDQRNRIIDLNGEPVTYLLHLRKQKFEFEPLLKNI